MFPRPISVMAGVLIIALTATGPLAVSPQPSSASTNTARLGKVTPPDSATAQNAFGIFLNDAMIAFPDVIVDYSWNQGSGTVLVKAQSVAAVQEFAAAADADVAIEPSIPQALPMRDRSSREMAAIELFAGVEYQSIGARYDPSTGAVIVRVWTENPAAIETQIDQALDRADPQLARTLRLEFITNGDAPRTESVTRGGMPYSGCTGGFIGTRGSTYGIITAAHCTTKPSWYDGDNTGSTYVASQNADLRYTVLSGGTPVNKFWNGSSNQTITATGIVVNGFWLSKYGRTTGYGQSWVDHYAGCQTFVGGDTWCFLYKTSSHVTAGGDSGGPWFITNTAYATTTGGDSAGSYITPIAYVGYISGGTAVKTN